MPSSTIENYLKHLLLLQQKQDSLGEPAQVATGKIASSLEVTPGTATVMVKSLAEAGLVDYESRSGARLTHRGEKLALEVIRRHRIVELFLGKILGLDWSEVHEEAEVLEHAVSEKVLVRMDELLGHPAFDPHGDPIPDAMGKVRARKLSRLDECRPGQPLRVSQVENSDPAFLRFAESRGLTPGAALTIQEADPMSDALMVQCDGGTPFVVGMSAARRVFVSPAR